MKNLRFNQLLLLGIFLLSSVISYGQSGDALKKLNAAKIGLITERLGLSPNQAEKFWPLYQEYASKKKAIQSDFTQIKKNYNRSTATEDDTRRVLKQGQEIKQKKLNLEKEYSSKMLNVIDSKQLMSLNQAEGEFREMLLKRLEQRQNQQRGKEQIRERNQQRLNQKRN
jgi:hypothetical protein